MFSSFVSLIFGSNTTETTNSKENQNPIREQQEQNQKSSGPNVRIDAENTIEVTSLTPSVTGSNKSNSVVRQGKRGKNKRNKNRNKQQLFENGKGKGIGKEQLKPTPQLITKLLTPCENFDDSFDDWCFIDKEDDEKSLSVQSETEDELSISDIEGIATPLASSSPPPPPILDNAVLQERQEQRRQLIHSHSLYSGPRPQQHRNYSQRVRSSGARGGNLNALRLSPPRNVVSVNVGAGVDPVTTLADVGVTQSLYLVSPNQSGSDGGLMDDSWYITPPPCFTSIGPINMETSPFENLLIEHPSMSVYHSIRSAQEATESFVNLDLGVEESQQGRDNKSAVAPATQSQAGRNASSASRRSSNAYTEQYSATQLKQELLARKTQKSHDKKNRENICRGAIKRANKVREFQSKGRRQRRSDMQHCKVVSGANNNRKCCY